MNAADGWTPLLLIVAGICGALLLRQAWKDASPLRPWLTAAGWIVITAAVAVATDIDGLRGSFLAAIFLSIGAMMVIATGWQVRPTRAAREGVLDPERRHTILWRAAVRFLLAGPLGFVAASGAGIAYAVFTPGDMQTRIVLGGLLVPAVWAGCMAWTLADDRLLRSTAVISLVVCLTVGFSAWKYFL